MIAELKGLLSYKGDDSIVVDVNGVGYDLTISSQNLQALPALGEPVHFFVYTHVAESVLALYGFASRREKALFKKLLSVSGIGPKSAVQVLSGLSIDDLVEAIMNENLATLTSISGIGKKTAERLLVELKDKMLEFVDSGSMKASQAAHAPAKGVLGEVFSALMNLGYQRSMAEKAVAELRGDPNLTFEDAFRRALSLLAH